jgi:hypothetical protein
MAITPKPKPSSMSFPMRSTIAGTHNPLFGLCEELVPHVRRDEQRTYWCTDEFT